MSEIADLVAAPAPAGEAARAGVGAAALLEARRTVHGLVRAGLEGHAGDAAAARADSLEHLARATRRAARLVATTSITGRVGTPVALSSARGAAVRAAGRLGEPAAGIEVLLTSGKGETLAAVAAGQNHVTRHVVDGSLGTNQSAKKCERSNPAGTGKITSTLGSVDTTRLYGRGTTPAEPV